MPYSSKFKTDYVSWRGGNFTPTDRDVLLAIPTTVRVTQGGLSFAPASAMTHAGLGAFDLNTDGMTKDEVWELSRELLRSGIVPFPRGFNYDSFQGKTISNTNDGNEHLHCVSANSKASLHQEARDQLAEWARGGDGLVGNAKYYGPDRDTPLGSWAGSPYNPKNIAKVPADISHYEVTASKLLGLNVDRETKKTTPKGARIDGAKKVKRWGRWNVVTSAGIYYAEEYLKAVKKQAPVDPGKA